MRPSTRLLTAGIRAVVGLAVRMVGTIAVATFGVFAAIEMSIPGGFQAVVLPNGVNRSSPRDMAVVEAFHLDSNVLVRWGHWVVDLLSGDFGRSARAGTPVLEVLTHRLSISLELMLAAVLLTVLLGVPLGLLAALRDLRGRGRILNAFLGFAQSIPVYLTPIFMVAVFAVRLRWLPASGWVRISDSLWGNLRNLLMPMIALAFAQIGIVARVIRADVLRVLQEDYITAAVGKGLPTRTVLVRHALRPASLGLLNVVGLNIGALLSGAILVEIIFGIGGLGQVLLEATLARDLYLIVGLTVYTVVVYVALSAIVDALMLAADPRLRRPTTRLRPYGDRG